MNKKSVIVAAFAVMVSFSASALAADAPAASGAAPLTFGFVDVNKVLQTTDAAKNILSQMDTKYKEYQSKITKEEEALRTMEADLAKQKDKLSKEDFEKKYKELQERFVKEQKMVQDSKRTFDRALSGAMNNLRGEAAKVVASLAKEKHLAAVFTQDSVIMAVPELDMTSQVIEQMNKTVKKVTVDWAAADTDGKKK